MTLVHELSDSLSEQPLLDDMEGYECDSEDESRDEDYNELKQLFQFPITRCCICCWIMILLVSATIATTAVMYVMCSEQHLVDTLVTSIDLPVLPTFASESDRIEWVRERERFIEREGGGDLLYREAEREGDDAISILDSYFLKLSVTVPNTGSVTVVTDPTLPVRELRITQEMYSSHSTSTPPGYLQDPVLEEYGVAGSGQVVMTPVIPRGFSALFSSRIQCQGLNVTVAVPPAVTLVSSLIGVDEGILSLTYPDGHILAVTASVRQRGYVAIQDCSATTLDVDIASGTLDIERVTASNVDVAVSVGQVRLVDVAGISQDVLSDTQYDLSDTQHAHDLSLSRTPWDIVVESGNVYSCWNPTFNDRMPSHLNTTVTTTSLSSRTNTLVGLWGGVNSIGNSWYQVSAGIGKIEISTDDECGLYDIHLISAEDTNTDPEVDSTVSERTMERDIERERDRGRESSDQSTSTSGCFSTDPLEATCSCDRQIILQIPGREGILRAIGPDVLCSSLIAFKD
ncbi:hypothetical protein KIPB_006365 [Kipferlia bialata]|uniref:Adhesin domain-containing protein n=1 Tax=Kipferlia bialata TaxID=797122 RepID=A0A9K3CYE3_9EUKA|nr:hypothetical protein KIPB_006365 [Kipferlia bialata]|eukprot:g6365.t1